MSAVENDVVWMRRALELAHAAAAMGEVPVGAVVVLDDEIIGEGFNQPITKHDPSAHAEILALREAAARRRNYRLPKASLYVTIEPCTMCLGAIVHARLKRVVFGAMEPKAGVFVSHPQMLQSGIYNHQFSWRGGVCERECAQVMQAFFHRRRQEKRFIGSSD